MRVITMPTARSGWTVPELSFCPIAARLVRSRHAVNEADPKKRERARRAAEQEIFQARFGGAEVGFVERRHNIKREASELEADEDHEQFFAADEQHESDRGQQKHGEILAGIAGGTVITRKEHSEKGERETDNLE